MRETNVCIAPLQRLGLPYIVVQPADATRLLQALVRPVLVAALLLVLTWGLVWASQEAARVVTGAVAPVMSASIETRSVVSEQDLQSRVDAYLADLRGETEIVDAP